MTEPESEQQGAELDVDDPSLYQDVGGRFPIHKMMTLAKTKQPFHLKMKGVKIAGGGRRSHKVIEPKSRGGGVIKFAVGASVWEIEFAFEDLELDEKKEILIYGG